MLAALALGVDENLDNSAGHREWTVEIGPGNRLRQFLVQKRQKLAESTG